MSDRANDLSSAVTWVVVADASQADIYSRQKRHSKLELVHQLAEPEARSKEQDFSSDAPGRTFDSSGQGRHAMEPDHTGKEHLRTIFAQRIAAVLESARQSDHFGGLILVASPALLGELRKHLNKPTRRLVVAEFSKEITDQKPETIEKLIDGLS
jgi:protein required for attachment to host cells